MEEPQIDNDLIDEAVLALMFLTLHDDGGSSFYVARLKVVRLGCDGAAACQGPHS